MNDLVSLEQSLTAVAPKFDQVLSPLGIPPERIIRTMMISVERAPKLLDCTRQSLMNAAMSAACLGLEVDGATGQAFLIPFAKHAQLVVGYKGFVTIAARAGFTINAAVVREGDEFEYRLGSDAFINHSPKLGNEGRIVGAWAVATAKGQPPIIAPPLSIQELNAVKARSPGAKKKDSPWNDPAVGFPAMCVKTAIRRLARFMPLNTMIMAAAMDEAFEERGKPAHVTPDRGVVIDGEAHEVLPQRQEGDPDLSPPRYVVIDAEGGEHDCQTIDRWHAQIAKILQGFETSLQASGFRARMTDALLALREHHPENVEQVERALASTIDMLAEQEKRQ